MSLRYFLEEIPMKIKPFNGSTAQAIVHYARSFVISIDQFVITNTYNLYYYFEQYNIQLSAYTCNILKDFNFSNPKISIFYFIVKNKVYLTMLTENLMHASFWLCLLCVKLLILSFRMKFRFINEN